MSPSKKPPWGEIGAQMAAAREHADALSRRMKSREDSASEEFEALRRANKRLRDKLTRIEALVQEDLYTNNSGGHDAAYDLAADIRDILEE